MIYLTIAAVLILAAGLIVAHGYSRKAASPDYPHLTAEVWAGDEPA